MLPVLTLLFGLLPIPSYHCGHVFRRSGVATITFLSFASRRRRSMMNTYELEDLGHCVNASSWSHMSSCLILSARAS